MNVVGLKKEDLSNKKLITLKNFYDCINLYDLNLYDNDVYTNRNKNIDKYINQDDVVLIKVNEINTSSIKTDKVNTFNDCIISVSFNHNLHINLNINSTLKQINYDFFVGHSFTYIDTWDGDIYPINLNFSVINNIIHFYITYAFVETIDYNNLNEDNKLNNKSNNQQTDYSDLQYINISKEFV